MTEPVEFTGLFYFIYVNFFSVEWHIFVPIKIEYQKRRKFMVKKPDRLFFKFFEKLDYIYYWKD